MRRSILGLTAVLGLLMAGLAAAQDKDSKGRGEPKKPADVKREGRPPLHFNVDQLIKDYDRNGDGFLQRDEVPGYLREHFDELDANKDGKLSREELEKGAALLQPRRRPSDVVFILIETSDCDDECTGEIQRVYDVLRKLDKNNDGKIDAEELKAARQQLLEERVDSIIKELDRNGDGRISKDEARGRIKRDFDRIDTNKDGFIDRAELLRAASERVKEQKER
jgi:Ca2+-binding EF-hand superfamily protein